MVVMLSFENDGARTSRIRSDTSTITWLFTAVFEIEYEGEAGVLAELPAKTYIVICALKRVSAESSIPKDKKMGLRALRSPVGR